MSTEKLVSIVSNKKLTTKNKDSIQDMLTYVCNVSKRYLSKTTAQQTKNLSPGEQDSVCSQDT